jgi:hypothetical protein
MGKFSRELASQGKLKRGAPLHPEADGARVRVLGGKAVVTDGPFAESKEVLGGFWVVDVASREEALDIARRCPHSGYGIVEVAELAFRNVYGEAGEGAPYLFAFCAEPRIEDPDGSKLREMLDFSGTLAQQKKLLETAPLKQDPPRTRVETRGGKRVVTDGPFAELKEVVGGYGFVCARGRAEAIEIAKRYPHAKWGPIVVREIQFFDRT